MMVCVCLLFKRLFSVVMFAGMTVLAMNADASSTGSHLPVSRNIPHPIVTPLPHQPTSSVAPQTTSHTSAPKPANVQVPPSASVLKLKADVAAFRVTLDKYIKVGNQVDLDLTVVIGGIDTAAIIYTDLANIDQDSALLRDLLGVAKQVPALKDQASLLLSGLEQVKPSVTEAQKVSNEANATLIPMRNKLNTLDKAIRTLDNNAGRVETALNIYSSALFNAQQCADGLPQGATKTSIQNSIDNRANEIDPYVVKANNELIQIINDLNAIERSIQSDIKQAVKPLHQLEHDLNAVSRKLHALINPLHDLGALFKKEFSAEFPYPSPTFEDPIRIKHYKIGIRFHVILQGEKAIEREIEKLLSRELYSAAKVFGMERLIKDIEHDAMKELNAIQGRLSLNFPVDVPGLKTIKANFDAFEKEVFTIQMLNINAPSIDNLLREIQGEMPKCHSILLDCQKK